MRFGSFYFTARVAFDDTSNVIFVILSWMPFKCKCRAQFRGYTHARLHIRYSYVTSRYAARTRDEAKKYENQKNIIRRRERATRPGPFDNSDLVGSGWVGI